MKKINVHPFVLFLFTFYISSVITANIFSEYIKILFIFCTVILLINIVLFIFLKSKENSKSLITSYIISFLLALLFSFGFIFITTNIYYNDYTKYCNKTVTASGIVENITESKSYYEKYVVKLKSIDEKNTNFRIVLTVTDMYDNIKVGDLISFSAEFSEFDESSDGFPTRKYNLSKSLYMEAECSGKVEIVGEKLSFNIMMYKFRTRLASLFSISMGREAGGFASAIMFGDKSGLSHETVRNFKYLGISHLLALSGIHLSILTQACEKLLSRLRIFKIIRIIIMSAVTVFYMALCGFTASITRAGIMLLLSSIAFILSKERNRFTSLGLSALLILLVRPFSFYDIGLQLSFTSMCALIFADSLKIKEKIKKSANEKSHFTSVLQSVSYTVSSSLIIVLFTLPLSFIYFGYISLVSPISNVIFIPFFSIVLYSLVFLLITTPFKFIFIKTGYFVSLIIKLLLYIANKSASIPNLVISLKYPFSSFFILIILLFTVLFIILPKKRILSSILILCIFITQISVTNLYEYTRYNKSVINIINSNKNDMITIVSAGNGYIIDLSDGAYSRFYKAINFLTNQAVISPEAIVLTHYHVRHISSVNQICSSYNLDAVYIPEPTTDKDRDILESIQKTTDSYNVSTVVYSFEQPVQLGFSNVKVEKHQYLKRSTHPVIALSINSKDNSFAYIGTSSCEFTDTYTKLLSENETLYFGAHGPIYKNNFYITDYEKRYYFSSFSIDFLSGNIPSRGTIISNSNELIKYN